MGTVIQAGHIFSGGTIISIPPAGGDSTLYYLVSSHLPSDYAVYLYDSSGNELVRIPKPNDASDSWGNNIGTNDTKIAITDNNGNGALYIYDMDGSNMVKVTSSDASGNDRFGSQLEINSTKIIVGAPYAGPTHQQGSVYVYDLDGTNEVKITASDGAYGDRLSGWSSLAVSESKIFVGASDHDNKRGALYIYDMDGSNEAKVQPSDSAEGDEFSYVVAASETKVVATAAANGDHGAAYIFDHDGTNEVKIEPSVDSRNNAFGGASAAINDTHVAISDRAFNGQRGAIYIYNIDGTNEVRIEHPSHFAPYDFFGYNLAMSSSKVFTCPPNDDDGGSSTGNVYEYNLDGTGERTLPTPSTFAADSRFGQGLYIYDSSLIPSTPTFIAPPFIASAKWVVVGAKRDDDNGNDSGSVYVYDANDLSATPTKLTAFDGAVRDEFGQTVAATADKIFVGARFDDDNGENSGSVYVYDANDLSATPTKLTAFDGADNDHFGFSVATTDDKLVIGAFGDNDDGENSGSVYVYDANDLSATPTKLTAFDGVAGDYFGYSVAVAGDKIIAGAYLDDDDGENSGSVYVYDANDLSATPTKLTTFDAYAADLFGLSIAATDDKIVISAILDDDNGNNSGSVYVFDANNLSAQPTKLTAFDGAASDQFGRSVDISADKIIVGVSNDDNSKGSVYVYNINDLSATPTKLTAFDGADNDYFGWKVGCISDKIVVGAYGDDDDGLYSGSVYVYDANDLSATPTKLTAFDGAAGDNFGESVAIG